jgi:hypothetical protein
MHEGAHHPAINPYTLPANKGLRTEYREGMCKDSLDILNRTVMVATNPLHTDEEIEAIIHNIDQAARVALEDVAAADVVLKRQQAVDLQKFDA